jgi:hypothetical protein
MPWSASLAVTYFVHIYAIVDGKMTKKGKTGVGHKAQGVGFERIKRA